MNAIAFLYDYRKMLLSTSAQGIKARTSGNVMGVAWLIIYPLLFLALYYVVFSNILQVRVPGMSSPGYILLIFSGLVPFLSFSESFSVGTMSVIANRGLLKNTMFPIEVIIAKDVIVSHACMGVGMLMVWAAVIYFNGWQWSQLLLPIFFLLQIVMTIGVVWITSTLTVFFRDIQQAIPILILFMMMISPIAYTPDMVPEGMKSLLLFNPLAYLMTLYRSALFDGSVPMMDVLIYFFTALLIFSFGFFFISRLKVTFTNYV